MKRHAGLSDEEIPVNLIETGPEGVRMQLGDHTVVFPVVMAEECDLQSVALRLQSRPLAMAALIDGDSEAVRDLLPGGAPWLWASPDGASSSGSGQGGGPQARGHCSCGERGCAHLAQAAAHAAAAWAAANAEQRLALLGWTRQALLDAAFAAWAQAEPAAAAEEALRQAAGAPQSARQRGARDLAGLADWLADMASQGKLHQPGPQFHDVEVNLHLHIAEREAGGLGPDPAPWAALLPGVRGAADGLALVAARVRERAAETAAALDQR